MGMPHAAERWTRAEVWALPDDGKRRELIDGELVVTPAPAYLHQRAVTDLAYLLRHALTLSPDSTARLLTSPADLTLGEDEILQPDLFIYAAPNEPRGDWSDISSLLVAIENQSPSTARYDRGLKRLRYQRARVPEYWIVDLDGRIVERWRPDDARPEILNARLHWSSGDGAEVDLDLEAFFREVAGK
jgi:Uma2 family endonuclease